MDGCQAPELVLGGSNHGHQYAVSHFTTRHPGLDPLLDMRRQFATGVGGNENQIGSRCRISRSFDDPGIAQKIETPPTEVKLHVHPELLHQPVANLHGAVAGH